MHHLPWLKKPKPQCSINQQLLLLGFKQHSDFVKCIKASSSHKTEFKPALCARETALLPSSEAHIETLAHELLLPNVSELVSFAEFRNMGFFRVQAICSPRLILNVW